jgi:hypothetical protein
VISVADIKARVERAKRGFRNPDELSHGWGEAYARDASVLLEKLEAVRAATDELDDLAQSAKDNGADGVAQGIWAHVTRYNRILEGK